MNAPHDPLNTEPIDEFEPDEPRTPIEIHVAEQALFERLWYFRSVASDKGSSAELRAEMGEEDFEMMMALRRRIEIDAGGDALFPLSDWDLGVLSGKLSALRWVLGDEWDNLDT